MQIRNLEKKKKRFYITLAWEFYRVTCAGVILVLNCKKNVRSLTKVPKIIIIIEYDCYFFVVVFYVSKGV